MRRPASLRDPTPGEFRYVESSDWLVAILSATFITVLPPTILFLWLSPREEAPLYGVIPMTLVAAIAIPFLVRNIFEARTWTSTIDAKRNVLKARRVGLFGRVEAETPLSDIERLVIEKTDNDGEFFTAFIETRDGRRQKLVQGNHGPGVREVVAKFQTALVANGVTRPIIEVNA